MPNPGHTPELIIQMGHTDEVNRVSFSSDGKFLASHSFGKIKIWDANSGTNLRGFDGHSMAFSPHGEVLAIAAYEAIEFWEIVSGVKVGSIDFPDPTYALGMVFSNDGQVLVSGVGGADRKGQIKLWNVATRAELMTLVGHSDDVGLLALNHDGTLLASGANSNDDGTIRFWDPINGAKKMTLTGYTRSPKAIFAFSPDGKLFAAEGWKGIELRCATTFELLKTLPGHPRTMVGSMVFSPDSKTLLSGSGYVDHTASELEAVIKIWDVDTGEQLGALRGHDLGIWGLEFSPDGKLLASGSLDYTVKLWDVPTGKTVRTLSGYSGRTNSIAFSPDGRNLATVNTDMSKQDHVDNSRTVKLWDLRGGHGLRKLRGHTGGIDAVVFSPDSKSLASVAKEIILWDVVNGRRMSTFYYESEFASCHGFMFSPDGKFLMAGHGWGLDDEVKIWNVETGNYEGKLMLKSCYVDSVTPTAGGQLLNAVVREDFNLRNFSDDRCGGLYHLFGYLGGKHGFARSRDGMVAYNGGDQAISIYRVLETNDLVSSIPTDSNSPACLAFTPDNRQILIPIDRHIELWDIAPSQRVKTVNADGGSTFTLSPDGKILAVGGRPEVTLWDMDSGEQLLTMIADDEADWITVTPQGFFDGAPGAWEKILWRFSPHLRDIFPVEIYYNEFYYPDLLTDVLARKVRGKQDISQKDRRQPQIKLDLAEEGPSSNSFDTREIKLKIEVAEAAANEEYEDGSGVNDLRLFRNGSLIRAWRGALPLTEGAATLDLDVPIVAGENRFTAYAFNHDNIKSSDAMLIATGDESLRRPGTAYILTIGINSYANSDYDLSYAMADAQEFGAELEVQQKALAEFKQVEVIPILNQDATRANILLALNRLAGNDTEPLRTGAPAALEKIKRTEPEDAVILYFAGHGVAQQSRFYLIPHDLGYHGQRTGVDEAGLQTIIGHSISDLDLEQAFEGIDAGHLVLIIDACNSGQALEAEEKRRGPMNSKGLAQLAYEKGMYILTAAQGYQAALEAARLGHGYLTYALVEEGLRAAAAITVPGDEQILLRDWLDYATERVPQMQHEEMHRERGLGLAPLAFVEGEEQIADAYDRSVQRPRVFYRRELEPRPFVIARPRPSTPTDRKASLDDYEINQVLTESPSTELLRGQRKSDGLLIAIKIQRAPENHDSVRMFQQQVELLGPLHHPHVVELLAHGSSDRGAFYVMEFCSGQSLHELMLRRGRLEVGEVVPIILGALEGLEYVHQNGIVHRDIKPGHILLNWSSDKFIPKLTGFGLAYRPDAALVGGDDEGHVAGTLPFMSREQFIAYNEVGPVSDVFSIGATMYYALTQQSPYRFDSHNQVYQAILKKDIRPVRDVDETIPETVGEVIDRAVSGDAAMRFQTAAEFHEALAYLSRPCHEPPQS